VRVCSAATVPIGSYALRGERVLVYDPKESTVCASRCVHLTNTSSSVLAPGTVSVSDGGRLVAQRAFTPMLPHDDQLIAYGEDSTLSIERSVATSSAVTAAQVI
jgi:hypothetical protein